MPQPKIWSSSEALVSDLKSYWRSHEKAIAMRTSDWPATIREAVSGNTFRAFRNLPARPSVTFRDWALDALVTREYFNQLPTILTQDEYDNWLDRLVDDFRIYWLTKMKANIGFGPSYKLPNLLMKLISQRLGVEDQSRVLWFLHVPLDSYTLAGIRNFTSLPGGRSIPPSATMRFIDGIDLYKATQGRIRQLAAKALVPAIGYDYLAWDQGHRRIVQADDRCGQT